MKKNKVLLKLREARKEKGYSLQSLADELGVNYQTIGRIERGFSGVKLETLEKLAKILEVPIESLISNSNEKKEDNLSLIPTLYKELDKFYENHNIEISDSDKIELSVKFCKIIRDIQINVQNDEDLVKLLVQLFDDILKISDLSNLD